MNHDRGEYQERLSYDINGNIKSLYRAGKYQVNAPEKMDDLEYHYENKDNSNRLSYLKEQDMGGNAQSGYPLDSGQRGQTIDYDDNGNMTTQTDKGISTIAYNFLNLPYHVVQNGVTTEYLYRADGTKLKKSYGTGKVTDYLDGFQYELENGVAKLQFVPTSEGYYDFKKNLYIYNYVDHLGNTRLSYTKNSAGVLEILEENNYYPFGLKHSGYNNITGANPSYQYKYNGKELQETGMYDYGARFYMPDIGRWGVVDPLAEKYRRFSPYTYGVDDPIRFIDPDGREAMDPGDRFKTIKDAAKDFAKLYNDNSIKDKREYGTVIYQVTDKNGEKYYTYTTPNVSGKEDGVTPAPDFSIDNAKIVSAAHTHSNYDKKYDNDNPSPTDKKGAELVGMDAYISTPKGELLKYNVKINQTVILDKDIPSDKNHPNRSNNIDSDKLPKNEPTRGTGKIILDNIIIPIMKSSPMLKGKRII